MADQQLGMTAEDPLRSECLWVGYDDMFTGRGKRLELFVSFTVVGKSTPQIIC